MHDSQKKFFKINNEVPWSEERKVEIQEMVGIKTLASKNSGLS